MRFSEFEYFLPRELIAQHPLPSRDTSRLLVVDRRRKRIEHRVFKDLPEYFGKDDLLVMNDTKVMPCRLLGKRVTGGKVDVLLIKRKRGTSFSAFIKPARVRPHEKIFFDDGRLTATVISHNEISFDEKDVRKLSSIGVMPLPPYIKRLPEPEDRLRYQTVYAKKEGAIASPTAGLHFTKEMFLTLRREEVKTSFITLHVGIGTFLPVKSEDPRFHRMEEEYYCVPKKTQEVLRAAAQRKARICAVGTTTVRALETYAQKKRAKGRTGLFIYPGYKFKIVNALITNFHLPATTLFMLVCAFAGTALIQKAYRQAVRRKYRFYSYGDAMLIL